MEEYQVELMDYIKVFWKRKWLIIIPTLICVLIVGVISFLLPLVWEIDLIILPSHVLYQTKEAEFVEFTFDAPQKIAWQINQGQYERIISNELKINLRELPDIKAENLKDTKLVRAFIREKNIEKAKLILSTLFIHLKKSLDEKPILEKERASKKREILKSRIEGLETELDLVKKRVEFLESAQRENLKKGARNEGEILGNLLYSNEILLGLRYYDELDELLNKKKIDEMEEERRFKGIELTKIIKEPTSSIAPVAPKKKFNIITTGIISLFVFSMLALFLDYLKNQKLKSND